MSDVFRLAPKPTVAEEAKKEVVEILEKALADAKKGEIAACILLFRFADGEHGYEASTTTEFLSDVGHLELVKQRLIARYWNAADGG